MKGRFRERIKLQGFPGFHNKSRLQQNKQSEDFIINPDCSKINKVNAAESFKRPRPSIIKKRYLSKNEFGEQLFQNRLRPMLEKNKVFGLGLKFVIVL